VLKEPVQQEWVSYPEAERYSGLSHTTLWRYVGSGDLKAARVGRSIRIHLPSLRAFMEERAGGTLANQTGDPGSGRLSEKRRGGENVEQSADKSSGLMH
jgi:excisionase family DNA binding protein